MRVKRLGSAFNVNVSRREVEAFKDQWPCSGLPDKSICFQFETNGDLVNIWPDNIDGEALVALCQDAADYAFKKLNKPPFNE